MSIPFPLIHYGYPADINSPANVSEQGRQPKFSHAPFVSNFLLAFTGGLLGLEAYSHFVAQPYKTLLRALIGNAQRFNGMLGITHYGLKLHKDPNLHNALGALGSALFAVEGLARMVEAPKAHLPRTSLIGFTAASVKLINGGPVTTIPYLFDAVCNGAEYLHSISRIYNSGALKALQTATITWTTRDLAAMQRVTGRVMIMIATMKTLALMLETDFDSEERNREKFAKEVDDIHDRLEAQTWDARLESAARQSPESLKQALREFALEMEKNALSTSARFVDVLDRSPVDAKRLIERFPAQSLDAAREFRATHRLRYDEIAVKYKVREAFAKARQAGFEAAKP